MDSKMKVAVVRDPRRRAAVAQGRHSSPTIFARKSRRASCSNRISSVINGKFHPLTLMRFRRPLTPFSPRAQEVIVAEGASDASAAFDRFGFRREARVGRFGFLISIATKASGFRLNWLTLTARRCALRGSREQWLSRTVAFHSHWRKHT